MTFARDQMPDASSRTFDIASAPGYKVYVAMKYSLSSGLTTVHSDIETVDVLVSSPYHFFARSHQLVNRVDLRAGQSEVIHDVSFRDEKHVPCCYWESVMDGVGQ